MCMCKYICFIFSTLQNAFSFITIFYHTPTLHCFIWMNIHKNVMISNNTFIQLVSYHWTLYLDVASSIQFPPHYTFSIFFTIQLKKMSFFCLLIYRQLFFSGFLILPLYYCKSSQLSVERLLPPGVTSPDHFQHFKTHLQVIELKLGPVFPCLDERSK